MNTYFLRYVSVLSHEIVHVVLHKISNTQKSIAKVIN